MLPRNPGGGSAASEFNLGGFKMSEYNTINKEIDSCNMAYKLRDKDGNIFVFAGIENGFPVYRGKRGRKHIFDLVGYEVLEKYLKN